MQQLEELELTNCATATKDMVKYLVENLPKTCSIIRWVYEQVTSLSNPNGGRGRGRGVSNKLARLPVMPAFLPISKCNVANVASCTKLTFNCIYQLHLSEGYSRSTDHQKATATIDLLLIRRLCTKMHTDTHSHRRRQPTHKTPFSFSFCQLQFSH